MFMSSEVRVITTIGHLALQETTNIQTNDLKRGDIVRLKATKPVSEKPYGWAEVLVVADRTAQIRRFN
jgi:ribosomal protein S17